MPPTSSHIPPQPRQLNNPGLRDASPYCFCIPWVASVAYPSVVPFYKEGRTWGHDDRASVARRSLCEDLSQARCHGFLQLREYVGREIDEVVAFPTIRLTRCRPCRVRLYGCAYRENVAYVHRDSLYMSKSGRWSPDFRMTAGSSLACSCIIDVTHGDLRKKMFYERPG